MTKTTTNSCPSVITESTKKPLSRAAKSSGTLPFHKVTSMSWWSVAGINNNTSHVEARSRGFVSNFGRHQQRRHYMASESFSNESLPLLAESYPPTKFFLKKKHIRNAILSTIACSILFIQNCMTTLIVGFFPSYASKVLGLSHWKIACIFSIYPLCLMIASPAAAKASGYIGRQSVLSLGLFISALSSVCFAYSTSFTYLIVFRSAQGIGAAGAIVSIMTTMAEEFKHSIGRAIGLAETVVAVAFIISPSIGSYLYYSAGGYHAPFVFTAIFQVFCLMAIPLLYMEYSLPEGIKDDQNGGGGENYANFKDMINSTSALCWVSTVAAMASFGFIDPILGSHLNQSLLGTKHFVIGLGFAAVALGYVVVGIVIRLRCLLPNNSTNNIFSRKRILLLGLVSLVLGFLLLSPPVSVIKITLTEAWVLQWISLLLIGAGAASVIAPAVSLAVSSLRKDDGCKENSLQCMIGLFSAAVYMGQAIGPIVANVLMMLLPETESAYCSVVLVKNTVSCTSALPFASLAFALVLTVLSVIMYFSEAVNSSSSSDSTSLVTNVLQRDGVYGHFVYLDEEE